MSFLAMLQGPRADSYKHANESAPANSHNADKKKKKGKKGKADMNELKQELTMVRFSYLLHGRYHAYRIVKIV